MRRSPPEEWLAEGSLIAREPPWLERMTAGRWYALSGDAPDLGLPPTARGTRFLADTDPGRDPVLNPARTVRERLRRFAGREPKSPWHGVAGFSAITEGWNSAIYASRCGASGSMIVYGGGHNDYFGSSVHAFDLDTREWRRLSDGYVAGSDEAYGAGAVYPSSVYPDGSPLPPHTYDYLQYDARGNDCILFKGQIELGPNVKAVAIPHMFNLDAQAWRHGPRHPAAILNSGGFTTWDASRRIVWGHSGDDGGGNAFVGFAPDGDNGDDTFGRWTERFPSKFRGTANHNAMQIEPACDLIVVAAHARQALYAIDPGAPGAEAARLDSTGEKPLLRAYAALQYAPNLRCVVYFSPLDHGSVFTLAAPAPERTPVNLSRPWRWVARLPEAGTLDPIADAAGRSRFPVNLEQCFGRFRVVSFGTIDVAMLVRHVDTPVYAMRLD
ncbi:MAG TPA: hypothetical protein VF420_09760 [Casimicrobiaceae bacterium]